MKTFDDIRQWGTDRKIDTQSTPALQMRKLLEEAGELAGSIAWYEKTKRDIEKYEFPTHLGTGDFTTPTKLVQQERKAIEDFKDAVGDCVVVLTMMAQQYGIRIEDCIEQAYQEIKDRKGEMVDGVFVKQKEENKDA